MTKIAKPNTLFRTKMAEKPCPLGPHIHISPILRSTLSPGRGAANRLSPFCLFYYYQIYKEAAFGRLNYNICLLDGYTPSMFSNGVPHENQKTFLMQICKIAQESKVFETSVKLIKEYSTIWQNAGNVTFTF